MERQKKLSGFSRIIICSLIVATLISLLFTCFYITIFELNENQLLYLFSTMAQVTGGLFGLTLTAYIFFVDKFKESTRGDDVLYDATMSILDRYFCNLSWIGIMCGIVILLCVFGIIDMHNWLIIYPFVINQGVILFIVLTISILAFGIALLEPNKLDKEVKRLKNDAEKHYKSGVSETGDFREFLKSYNLLEHLIINFAEACLSEKKRFLYDYKPQIIQSLKVLTKCDIIDYILINEIHELRMYRNALVHGIDFSIAQEVCNRIQKIYETLNEAFEIYQEKGRDSEEWKNAKQKIYELSEQEAISKTDGK